MVTIINSCPDCNANDVFPDECDLDCNALGGQCQQFAPDCGLSIDRDCSSNGIPDECDADCDGSGLPDPCDPCYDEDFRGDYDRDCDVDEGDFGFFQECFTTNGVPPDPYCYCPFDMDTNGSVQIADYVAMSGVFTGPGTGGGRMLATGESGVSGPWPTVRGDVGLGVYAPGGRSAVETLAPNATYVLRYQAKCGAVDGYAVATLGSHDGAGFATASPAVSGAWSSTGQFAFLADMPLSGMDGHAGGGGLMQYDPWDLVTDMQPAPQASEAVRDGESATGSGTLFTFTTESSGAIVLDVYLWRLDEAGHRLVEMPARLTLSVGTGQQD